MDGEMTMANDCPYCGEPYLNFGYDDEGVKMRVDKLESGGYIIAVGPPYAWSAHINFRPFCGRKLKEGE